MLALKCRDIFKVFSVVLRYKILRTDPVDREGDDENIKENAYEKRGLYATRKSAQRFGTSRDKQKHLPCHADGAQAAGQTPETPKKHKRAV